MFERFTNRARNVVVMAQEEARELHHNYIGTEHLLLGLLREPQGVGGQGLCRLGMSLAATREEVKAIVGTGKGQVSGHIPFTPRAKKTLELALREAKQLHHNYIGTEHILLGLVRQGDGVAAEILKNHAPDLLAVRMEVLNTLQAAQPVAAEAQGRRWLRRQPATAEPGAAGGPAEQEETTELRTTPAADTSLDEAARLAAPNPVGSHHLLLAALADPDSAAARALAALGVNLDQARDALQRADVTGTSDEQPEEAGRRQMQIRVVGDRLAVEVTDPVLVRLGRAALDALGDNAGADLGGQEAWVAGAGQSGTVSVIGGGMPACASLSSVWQVLRDSLEDIRRRARPGGLDEPGTGVA